MKKEFKWEEPRQIPKGTIYNIVVKELVIKPFIKRIRLFEDDEKGFPTNIPLRSKSGRIQYGSFAAFNFECLLECRIKGISVRPNDLVSIANGYIFAVIQENEGALFLRNAHQFSIAPFFMNTYGEQPIAIFASVFHG